MLISPTHRSLKVMDLRLVNHGVFDLSSLEQELGLACCYVGVNTISPVVTVSEDSDDEDGDEEDEDEADGESAMEYEVVPHLMSTEQAAHGDNSSVKSGTGEIMFCPNKEKYKESIL